MECSAAKGLSEALCSRNMIDISWPLTSQATVWKDAKERKVAVTEFREWGVEGEFRESNLFMGLHSGTHVDAPAHFLLSGSQVHQIQPADLSGPCRVLDLSSERMERDMISDLVLKKHESHINEGEIILFKTKNSDLSPTAPFTPDYVSLAKSGAEFLASKKVKAVGTDYLGIEKGQPNHETHKTLLGHDPAIYIIEGLRLKHVEPGFYYLLCMPLLIVGAEGAPCRAVLVGA